MADHRTDLGYRPEPPMSAQERCMRAAKALRKPKPKAAVDEYEEQPDGTWAKKPRASAGEEK